jgi:pimeloyl-ACP methyl ester carboxylesterase
MKCRIHGDGPPIVYLPGLHGDWTLVGGFRRRLPAHVRFVEFAYPVSESVSLRELAAAIHDALEHAGVADCTLLAESFGSQVAWAMLAEPRPGVRVRRLVLSGGFVRHPWMGGVRLSRRLYHAGGRMADRMLSVYPSAALLAYERRPELRDDLRTFVENRGMPGDSGAIRHRLRLIAEADYRGVAARTVLPVHHLTGVWDAVVPWPPVRRWLRRHCPGYRGTRPVWSADHAVLVGRPSAAARQVLEWTVAQEP